MSDLPEHLVAKVIDRVNAMSPDDHPDLYVDATVDVVDGSLESAVRAVLEVALPEVRRAENKRFERDARAWLANKGRTLGTQDVERLLRIARDESDEEPQPDLDADYCPGCKHPWSYHNGAARGCTMPVVEGTNMPKTAWYERAVSCSCHAMSEAGS